MSSESLLFFFPLLIIRDRTISQPLGGKRHNILTETLLTTNSIYLRQPVRRRSKTNNCPTSSLTLAAWDTAPPSSINFLSPVCEYWWPPPLPHRQGLFCLPLLEVDFPKKLVLSQDRHVNDNHCQCHIDCPLETPDLQ